MAKAPVRKTVVITRGTRIGSEAAPIGSVHQLPATDAALLKGSGKAEILEKKEDIAAAEKAFAKAEKTREADKADAPKKGSEDA